MGSGWPDPWLERITDGVRLRRSIAPVLELLGRLATDLAPRFVTQQGRIVVGCVPIEGWMREGRRLSVGFMFNETDPDLPVTCLSAGLRRWVAASVREACRQLPTATITFRIIRPWTGEVEEFDDPSRRQETLHDLFEGEETDEYRDVRLDHRVTRRPSPGILLVDEPEVHLHPLAQVDIAQWLRQRSQENLAVIIATHSAAFLSYLPEQASLVRVHLGDSGTAVQVLDADLLGYLDVLQSDVGLGRAGILQLLRGVLAVEGRHDQLVIEHLYGRRLREQRIAVIPLHGAQHALSAAEGEILSRLDVPVRVILDHGHREASLLSLLRDRVIDIDVAGIQYEEPDIICALPEQAIRRAYPDKPFPGWDVLKERFGGKFGFKDHPQGDGPGRDERHAIRRGCSSVHPGRRCPLRCSPEGGRRGAGLVPERRNGSGARGVAPERGRSPVAPIRVHEVWAR